MPDRRTLSSSLSADVVNYLRKHGHVQAKIAKMLGVSDSYVSLVKSRERSLTLDHMERLADKLAIPLGALLLSVVPKPQNPTPDVRRFFSLCAKIVKEADAARDAALGTSHPGTRAP